MSLDFVAIDVETANNYRGSICAIGLAVVEGGQVTSTSNWLTRPVEDLDYFWGFNIALHGITPDMVANEARFESRWRDALDLIDGRPIVAHNAAFDVGAVREACDYSHLDWPELTYGCSLVLSRRVLTLLSYRLPLVCHELDIPLDNHHDAATDAEAAALVTLELARRQDVGSLEALVESVRVRLGQINPRLWRGCVYKGPKGGYSVNGEPQKTPPPNADADPDHPLFGQVIVFTGALGRVRHDAWEAAANLGAIPEVGVTKRTNLLVIGDGFVGEEVESFHTGKAVKAAKLLAKGQQIEVLDEVDFELLLLERTSSDLPQPEGGSGLVDVVGTSPSK